MIDVQVTHTIDHRLLEFLQGWSGRNNIERTLARIEHILNNHGNQLEKIMADVTIEVGLLNQIDATTNAAANNIQTVMSGVSDLVSVNQTISTELDALIAQLQSAGVSQEIIDQTTALATKSQAVADAGASAATAMAQTVAALRATAAKGAPVAPPPPAPVVVPPVTA